MNSIQVIALPIQTAMGDFFSSMIIYLTDIYIILSLRIIVHVLPVSYCKFPNTPLLKMDVYSSLFPCAMGRTYP